MKQNNLSEQPVMDGVTFWTPITMKPNNLSEQLQAEIKGWETYLETCPEEQKPETAAFIRGMNTALEIVSKAKPSSVVIQNTVRRMEELNAEGNLSLDIMISLCHALRCDPNYLLSRPADMG